MKLLFLLNNRELFKSFIAFEIILEKNITCSDIKIMKQIIDDKGRLLKSIKYSINFEILKDIQQHTILVISGGQITVCFYFLPWDFL